MATSTNTYGTSTGIERMVGDLFQDRTLSTSSVPTALQVDRILDEIASDMNRALRAAGYSAPISTGASDLIERDWAKTVNEYGAASRVLLTMPLTSFAPGAEDAGSNRAQTYQFLFQQGMDAIKNLELRAPKSQGRLANVFSGSQSDSDGNRKTPFFKRDEGDNPRTARGRVE